MIFKGYSRSLKIVPLGSLGTLSYWPYLVSFPRYSEILVENLDFLPHLYSTPM